jgi:hypothetical protein
MTIKGINEPKGNWQNPFLEIVLRGIRKANFNFENWDINQIPNNLENHDFDSLNNGWGVFKAPEEQTCSFITQEFASSPFTKGYWVATDENGDKDHRWYMIEREFHLGIKKVYPNSDFSNWATKLKNDKNSNEDELKNQVFDNSINSRWADILINRIGYSKDEFEIYIKWQPVLIEAKRITTINSKINFKPKFSECVFNYNEVLKDVRKLLGLKIGIKNKNTIFQHPHPKGQFDDFFPIILFWGLKRDCDTAIEELKNNEVSIKYDNADYKISKWFGLCKEYPHRIKDYEKNEDVDEILKVVLLEFEFIQK